MFKALVRKQFLELASSFFQNRKNKKKRSNAGIAGMIVYFIAILAFVGVMMYIFSGTFAQTLLSGQDTSFDWFYFALMGLLAVMLGTFGSIFSTMTTLYQAKDNELLLSMPIPPSMILTSRMIGIFAMGLLYSLLIWIPAIVRYSVMRHPGGRTTIYEAVLALLIALFVTVLSCAAGWLVALISGKLRNKSFITVILFLIFFGAYYFVCFRLNTILASLLARSDQISTAIRSRIYPLYALGRAAAGDTFSLIAFVLIVAVLFVICAFILSRTFIRIVTLNKGEKKAVYREKTVAQKNVRSALFGREAARFTKSATYMLNCGLGMAMMPAAAVVIFAYRNRIRQILPHLYESGPQYSQIIMVMICIFVCLAEATNPVTAPSVSLEGRSIWLAQSLPVRTIDILHAKEKLHILLNLVPSAVSLLILAYVFETGAAMTLLMLACVVLFIVFSAGFGLKRGLKHPNLRWTSESIPIKQGAAVLISLFACWGICLAAGGLYVIVGRHISAAVWLGIFCAVLLVLICLNERWIRKKGTEIFEGLD